MIMKVVKVAKQQKPFLVLRTYPEQSSQQRSAVAHLSNQLDSYCLFMSWFSQMNRPQPIFEQHTTLMHWKDVKFLQP